MGIFGKVEGGIESAVDAAAGAVFRSSLEPAQIAKKAEKQMQREKLVGAGRQYAPTLYNVLVNPVDDRGLFGFYPTMAAELETYLVAKGQAAGLTFDGRPLVRFIVDEKLKPGKFDVIAETVAAVIIEQLRAEERQFYGIQPHGRAEANGRPAAAAATPAQAVGPRAPRAQRGAAPALDAIPAAALQAAAQPPIQAIPAAYLAQGGSAVVAATPSGALAAPRPGAHAAPPAPAPRHAAATGRAVPASLYDVRTGASYALNHDSVVLGRDASCSIRIDDINASRTHAQVSLDASGAWKLADLDSTNGTLLNDVPVQRAILQDGDIITIGTTMLEFVEG
jgi:hypothetical protein